MYCQDRLNSLEMEHFSVFEIEIRIEASSSHENIWNMRSVRRLGVNCRIWMALSSVFSRKFLVSFYFFFYFRCHLHTTAPDVGRYPFTCIYILHSVIYAETNPPFRSSDQRCAACITALWLLLFAMGLWTSAVLPLFGRTMGRNMTQRCN